MSSNRQDGMVDEVLEQVDRYPGMEEHEQERGSKKVQGTLTAINHGREIMNEEPRFPASRECRDAFAIVFYLIMVLGVCGVAASYRRDFSQAVPQPVATYTCADYLYRYTCPLRPKLGARRSAMLGSELNCCETNFPCGKFVCTETGNVIKKSITHQEADIIARSSPSEAICCERSAEQTGEAFDFRKVDVYRLTGAVFAAGTAAFFVTLSLVILSKFCGTCVVWTSLLFSCILMIVMGISMIGGAAAVGNAAISMMLMIIGGVFIAMGCCFGACMCCCWSKFVPFTAAIVTYCGDITLENPGMFVVALLGAACSAAWAVIVGTALDGMFAEHQDLLQEEDKYKRYAFWGGFFFVWTWGCMVSAGVCYTTFCGVFGRWYYSEDESKPGIYDSGVLAASFIVASTTSLGSIIFGTGLVAVIRTVEFMARQARQDAQSEGNAVACIAFCCLECIISCIGDILEYFNEWAFVQCALRGTSYIESATVVYSLCTMANVWAVWSTLLIDSVVSIGSFMAALVAALVGALIGYTASLETCILSALFGLLAGNGVGWCIMSIFSAGSKTLCTCWAEHPDTLLHKANTDEAAEELPEWFGGSAFKSYSNSNEKE